MTSQRWPRFCRAVTKSVFISSSRNRRCLMSLGEKGEFVAVAFEESPTTAAENKTLRPSSTRWERPLEAIFVVAMK